LHTKPYFSLLFLGPLSKSHAVIVNFEDKKITKLVFNYISG